MPFNFCFPFTRLSIFPQPFEFTNSRCLFISPKCILLNDTLIEKFFSIFWGLWGSFGNRDSANDVIESSGMATELLKHFQFVSCADEAFEIRLENSTTKDVEFLVHLPHASIGFCVANENQDWHSSGDSDHPDHRRRSGMSKKGDDTEILENRKLLSAILSSFFIVFPPANA